MSRTLCCCSCHISRRADSKATAQMGKYLRSFDLAQQAKNWELHWPDIAPETDDVIAAALACDKCRNLHCPALLVKDRPEKSEWIDPPPPAEACNGEGDE